MAAQNFQRNTQQRDVIVEELCKTRSHPTAAELYEVVRRRIPRISLGTVYRNLDLLARLGRIHKLEMTGAETRFDGDTRRHDHVRCVGCGRVDDLPGAPLDLPEDRCGDLGGYAILGHRLEYQGLCAACRQCEAQNKTISTTTSSTNQT